MKSCGVEAIENLIKRTEELKRNPLRFLMYIYNREKIEAAAIKIMEEDKWDTSKI